MCTSLFLVTYLTKFTQKTNVACDCGEFSGANTHIRCATRRKSLCTASKLIARAAKDLINFVANYFVFFLFISNGNTINQHMLLRSGILQDVNFLLVITKIFPLNINR